LWFKSYNTGITPDFAIIRLKLKPFVCLLYIELNINASFFNISIDKL